MLSNTFLTENYYYVIVTFSYFYKNANVNLSLFHTQDRFKMITFFDLLILSL